MKKKLIPIIAILLVCVSIFSTTASAQEIQPYYNNTVNATASFTISSTGNAHAAISYQGISGVTTKAIITSYIQHKVGFLWFRVDNGQPNNEWVDILAGPRGTVSHSLQLSERDDYRLVVEFEIQGTGGSADKIKKIVEYTY